MKRIKNPLQYAPSTSICSSRDTGRSSIRTPCPCRFGFGFVLGWGWVCGSLSNVDAAFCIPSLTANSSRAAAEAAAERLTDRRASSAVRCIRQCETSSHCNRALLITGCRSVALVARSLSLFVGPAASAAAVNRVTRRQLAAILLTDDNATRCSGARCFQCHYYCACVCGKETAEHKRAYM